MLCMDREKTFYRKYAFGEASEKLNEQLVWLEEHQGVIPICDILHKDCGNGWCCYDMAYVGNAYGMFQYMHSQPFERSWSILKSILDTLCDHLYTLDRRKPDENSMKQYFTEKVDRNMEKIQGSRILTDFIRQEYIIINGKKYKNLPEMDELFDYEYLRNVFSNDNYSDIHGDLTIENIICLDNERDPSKAYYIIDPNTGNIHNSSFLDFGKLLQSLHGGYEFMMMTKNVKVNGNRVDFLYTRSTIYDEMLEKVKGYLRERFTEAGVRSIFHHELIHWLRLMPYKLENDKKRAAMFYAGLVMVANDIEEWYG